MRRRLVLLATTKPWMLERALEELGDALYPYDESVEIVRDERAPLLYVYSRGLEPWRAFRTVLAQPPAYVERLIPVEYVVEGGVDAVAARACEALRGRGATRVWVEAKPRGYFLSGREREVSSTIGSLLSGLGCVEGLARRSPVWLKVEDSAVGVVVAVMPARWDRVSFWRERRLRV